ncbi:MAG: hypothetical protein ACI92G_002272 [Candidatus Pelagisphaera sp.]|jgi:hypothetical protein
MVPTNDMETHLDSYDNQSLLFGDLHNHCGLSYGHGSLEDALKNAREQLDFVSITGHAHWPDMPEPDERIQYIIDFHEEGFAKLKRDWPKMMDTLKGFNDEDSFVIFPGFEIHSNADGDRTILYKNFEGKIIYADSIPDLHDRLATLKSKGVESIAFPHHIGYRTGTRGINWSTYDAEWGPFIELLSMHGCSESSENTRPFLHSMGGSDWESTIQYGLSLGHVFGFSGHTDHHSGHPGSYGHGVTGLWSEGRDRQSIWKALQERRTYALTGDRIQLEYTLNGAAMGSVIPPSESREIKVNIQGGGAIDCVDIIKNNELVHRVSQTDIESPETSNTIRTLIYLELGWGERNKVTPWEVELGLSAGRIIRVEPRFRGREVVSPVEGDANEEGGFYESKWTQQDDRSVQFTTVTRSNPNNATNASQGICLEVEIPVGASIQANLNGKDETMPIERLTTGARTGHLGGIDSPAYRFHRAPLKHEFQWSFDWTDHGEGEDNYYIRIRQQNDQWAWSSPVYLRKG